jgi:hypothetical protein
MENTNAAPITRHSFTARERGMLNAAVALDIIDAVELGCMIAEHGADAQALFSEIGSAANANYHMPTDSKLGKARIAWHKICESVMWLAQDDGRDDKHGFAADARKSAIETLAAHRID